MNKLIGTKEAAEKLGIGLRRAQQLIELGTLPAQRIGRDYLIQEKDLSNVTIYGKRGRPKKLVTED
jgi:excisionase family DNA binding protein